MKDNVCVNGECRFCDSSSETGCTADLSTWEDCQVAEFEDDEE